MRFIILILVFVLKGVTASAEPLPFKAGVDRIAVPDDPQPFNAVIWYPVNVPEVPWQAGPFTVTASLGAPVADDRKFPVVLLSHGHLGSPLSHRDLAAGLARNGFVVIAPTHIGDAAGQPLAEKQGQVLIDRPRQAIKALEAVLSDPKFTPHIDHHSIGMIGYSAGGYTTLILAGAKPDFAYQRAWCADHDDMPSCGVYKDGQENTALSAWKPPSEPRLKAIVLMDPQAVMFNKTGLAAVRIPTLLLRPENDAYQAAERNASTVATGLPLPPQQIVVPGKHFVFIDPCPDEIAAEAPLVCTDAPGIDRVAIHRQIEAEIAQFLRESLQPL